MIQVVAAGIYALALWVQIDAAEQELPEIIVNTDTSGRFMMLERYGDEKKRHAYVTVFEYLGKGKSLRKLHEVELLNKYGPLGTVLSSDGRFLLTMDEWTSSGTSPVTIVIYDLVRKEHTAYAGKDFLSAEVRKSLSHHGFIKGFKWFTGSDVSFNRDSTKFYPTSPENCQAEKVPFIEVDLLSRTVSIRPIASVDPKTLVPRAQQDWGWNPSRETVATKTTVLPARITWQSQGEPDRVLELDASKTEYRPRSEP